MGVKDAVRNTATKFRKKAFIIRSFEEHNDRSASGFEMRKVLGAFDLISLGIGCIIGAGIVVLTGVAARDYAGPGVVLSYVFGSIAAMLTAFCYAEFAAEFPVAGGAFNYVSLTYGEFAAWVAACDLVLEYTLSAAAVAKGFTAYLASLIQVDLGKMRLQYNILTLDFPALAIVVLLSLVLMRSTRESSWFNVVVVVIHMLLILFVVCAGFPFAKAENYTPFLSFGMRGVFSGASVIFFSFIGFDTVSTAAEEVKNPRRDLPIGIIGSLGICTILYVLMCLVITGMQPYYQIDRDAPFSVAFDAVGLHWARTLVALGALAGILTSLLGSLLGQARIYVVLGRQYLLPPWIARVSERTGTPVNATKVTMVTAGLLALFFDIEVLSQLVSIGTLVVFAMVCSGILFRRYWVLGGGEPMRPVGLRMLGIVIASVGVSLSYTEEAHIAVPIVFLVLWAAATASFLTLPVRYTPTTYRCPWSPWLPSLGVLACLHLIGSLGWLAYVRWMVWFTIGTAVYLLYGLHNSQGDGQARQAAKAHDAAMRAGRPSGSGNSHLMAGAGPNSTASDHLPWDWALDEAAGRRPAFEPLGVQLVPKHPNGRGAASEAVAAAGAAVAGRPDQLPLLSADALRQGQPDMSRHTSGNGGSCSLMAPYSQADLMLDLQQGPACSPDASLQPARPSLPSMPMAGSVPRTWPGGAAPGTLAAGSMPGSLTAGSMPGTHEGAPGLTGWSTDKQAGP